jgi:hypothetical protein
LKCCEQCFWLIGFTKAIESSDILPGAGRVFWFLDKVSSRRSPRLFGCEPQGGVVCGVIMWVRRSTIASRSPLNSWPICVEISLVEEQRIPFSVCH